jgi:transcriptional regulator GlxA family with amidase domain
LYGLYDLLSTTGVAWEGTVSGNPVNPQFDVRIVAAQRQPFGCARGVLVSPHFSTDAVKNTDIVVIASLAVPNTGLVKGRYQKEIEWIKREYDRGTLIASACTGLLVLAESGLLDDGEATTHWAFADLIRVNYPGIQLKIERNLCRSGFNNRIVTSGGTTAWQELALFLITRYCGAEHAAHAAKFWLIQNRTEYQSAFSAMSRVAPIDDGIVSETREWIAAHFSEPNPVRGMVFQSGLSATTFTRRFRKATGYRPIDYVHFLRIDKAKEILETKSDAVEQIGRDVGYEDPASFRRIFKRKVGMTPGLYRRQFGRSRFERYELL